jgi:N-acetyl-anhydromuramyl-L-alanine amidase AmpD
MPGLTAHQVPKDCGVTETKMTLTALNSTTHRPALLARRILLLTALWLTACSNVVEVPSSNYGSRVKYLVLHATSEDFAESLRLLTQPTANPVSSHYLVPAPGDPSYTRSSLRVHRLVPELERAWHAGVSYWAEETGLNDRSIGIEIVNEFKCSGTSGPVNETVPEDISCEFPSYDEEQIALVIELVSDILARYPSINPIDVVGHSDIAILRKSDPGPKFPWKRLYEAGIGAWYQEDLKADYEQRFEQRLPDIATVQDALNRLGYFVETTGQLDNATRYAMRAMQLHFRPRNYTGEIDAESVAIIWALLEKYRPRELEALLKT